MEVSIPVGVLAMMTSTRTRKPRDWPVLRNPPALESVSTGWTMCLFSCRIDPLFSNDVPWATCLWMAQKLSSHSAQFESIMRNDSFSSSEVTKTASNITFYLCNGAMVLYVCWFENYVWYRNYAKLFAPLAHARTDTKSLPSQAAEL